MINKSIFLENKRVLIKNLILLVGTVLLILAFIRLTENNYKQFAANIFYIFVLLWSYIKLSSDNSNFVFIARVAMLVATAMAFYQLLNMYHAPMRFVWFSTVVYLIFYLFDKIEGRLWTFIIGAILFAIFIYDRSLLDINGIDFFIWIFNMFIILMIVNWYENIKEESTQRLINVQQTLSSEVESKTAELWALNEELEKRIEEKGRKVRYQEQMSIRQSKQAQMGEMLSMIAHQWRQPLTAISATSSLIELKARAGKLDPETIRKSAKDISNYAQHLSATINDFRDFFKSNKELQVTNYKELVESVLGIVETSMIDENIQLHKELNCEVKFYSYPNELKQVILNLIKNAEDVLLEKKIEKPFIKLFSYQDNDKFILEVSDNGGGISKEILENIFDLYFSTKQEKNGTGLGLYMSKIIIDEHCGGELSVENIENGALFRITLYQSS